MKRKGKTERGGGGRRERKRKKGRNIRRGRAETTGIQGEPASFLHDVLTLERTALRPLSPFHPPRRHVLRRFLCPLGQPRHEADADGPEAERRSRGEQRRGGRGGEQKRADSRGRETFQSLVAKSACLPGLPACSLARLSAHRLPSHRPKPGPRYTKCHTDDRNCGISRDINPIDFYFELTMNYTVKESAKKWSENSKRDARK